MTRRVRITVYAHIDDAAIRAAADGAPPADRDKAIADALAEDIRAALRKINSTVGQIVVRDGTGSDLL